MQLTQLIAVIVALGVALAVLTMLVRRGRIHRRHESGGRPDQPGRRDHQCEKHAERRRHDDNGIGRGGESHRRLRLLPPQFHHAYKLAHRPSDGVLERPLPHKMALRH